MPFDPTRRENLSPAQRTAIGQVIQYGLIDEIFNANAWTPEDVVFHGGTSIHVVWNSPRYSEDLDFMIDVSRAADVAKVMDRAVKAVSSRLLMSLPGSELKLKRPSDEPGLHDTLCYTVVWSHPNKHGTVKVKAEFYTTEPEHIRNYRRNVKEGHRKASERADRMTVTTTPDISDLGFDPADLAVRSLIPAAHPESIYADKLVALSMRPYLKFRDFFDLWWLKTQLRGVSLDDGAAVYDAVRRSADIYGYDDATLLEGIRRFQETPPEMTVEIEQNLKAFLPEQLHRRMVVNGNYAEMYEHAMSETSRLAEAIEARMGPGMRL